MTTSKTINPRFMEKCEKHGLTNRARERVELSKFSLKLTEPSHKTSPINMLKENRLKLRIN